MTDHPRPRVALAIDRVCVFPGLRKHSPHVRTAPGEVCTVVELPTGGRPGDGQSASAVPAVAVRRPSGEALLVDADLVGRLGG